MVGSDFITQYRQYTTAWLQAMEELMALKGEYVALDLGNTLTQGDFAGTNSDIDLPDLVAAVGSIDAINAVLVQGHNTNLYKLKQ